MLKRVLWRVGSICILMAATSPMMLCFGIVAPDGAKFFHNWLIYVVMTSFFGFVCFVSSQVVD
jgi:hypothetical protein